MDEKFWANLDVMHRAVERATSSSNVAMLVTAADAAQRFASTIDFAKVSSTLAASEHVYRRPTARRSGPVRAPQWPEAEGGLVKAALVEEVTHVAGLTKKQASPRRTAMRPSAAGIRRTVPANVHG